jgi:hypothetical protein
MAPEPTQHKKKKDEQSNQCQPNHLLPLRAIIHASSL